MRKRLSIELMVGVLKRAEVDVLAVEGRRCAGITEQHFCWWKRRWRREDQREHVTCFER